MKLTLVLLEVRPGRYITANRNVQMDSVVNNLAETIHAHPLFAQLNLGTAIQAHDIPHLR